MRSSRLLLVIALMGVSATAWGAKRKHASKHKLVASDCPKACKFSTKSCQDVCTKPEEGPGKSVKACERECAPAKQRCVEMCEKFAKGELKAPQEPQRSPEAMQPAPDAQ